MREGTSGFERAPRTPSSSSRARRSTRRCAAIGATQHRRPAPLLIPTPLFLSVQLETVAFDYEDRSTYAAALRGVTSVLLVTTYTVDMLVHSKLFTDAAKAAGVKHMVVGIRRLSVQ